VVLVAEITRKTFISGALNFILHDSTFLC
jgi:hypothetical protein